MALTNTQYDTIIREYNKKQLQNRRDQEARIALAEKELPELEMCPPPSGRGGCFDR